MSVEHTELINQILIKVSENPNVRAWKQQNGVAKSFYGDAVIRYGLNGSADISGIIQGGFRLEIEVKVGKDEQSDKQKKFQKMIESKGGFYFVARNVEETLDALEKFIKKKKPLP